MADSVIDALYVTLGMKSESFQQGIKSATDSLTGFATKVAGLALGFQGLQAGIHYFESLHQKLSDLYFTSRNLGIMGTELSQLGELAQLFGGRIEDATGSVMGLQAAVFNLRFKGQMSESLAMLQRFGVAYLNGNGTMRDPEAIARDAAVAIERQSRVANLTPADRYQLALSFGLQGGLASAAAQGPAGFDTELARARRDQRGLTEGTLRGQAQLERDVISRRTSRDVQMAGVLSALLPDLEKLNEMLAEMTRRSVPLLIKGIDGLNDFFLKKPPAWLTQVENGLKDIGEKLGPTGSLVAGIAALTVAMSVGSKVTALAAGIGLRAIPAVGAGLAGYGLTTELFKALKIDPGAAIGHAIFDLFNPAYDPNAPNPVAHGRIVRPPASPHALVTPSAPRPASDSGGKPTAMNGAPSTNITFENVTINSRGQDGETLARDFEGRIKRGYLVSNSDPGQSS